MRDAIDTTFAAATDGYLLAEKGVAALRAELAGVEAEVGQRLKAAVHDQYPQFVRATPGAVQRVGKCSGWGYADSILWCSTGTALTPPTTPTPPYTHPPPHTHFLPPLPCRHTAA